MSFNVAHTDVTVTTLAALRWWERRSRQFLHHEKLTIAMIPILMTEQPRKRSMQLYRLCTAGSDYLLSSVIAEAVASTMVAGDQVNDQLNKVPIKLFFGGLVSQSFEENVDTDCRFTSCRCASSPQFRTYC